MPLRPLKPGTNAVKPFTEYSDAEKRSHIRQVLDEQLIVMQSATMPVDERALAQCETWARELKDAGLVDQITAALRTIAAGPVKTTDAARVARSP
jgi:hypothetical protein